MFAAEKLSQQFEKVFFGQSFVNRNLLQSVEDSTIKFIYLESKIKPKMKNNFIKHKRKDHKL